MTGSSLRLRGSAHGGLGQVKGHVSAVHSFCEGQWRKAVGARRRPASCLQRAGEREHDIRAELQAMSWSSYTRYLPRGVFQNRAGPDVVGF